MSMISPKQPHLLHNNMHPHTLQSHFLGIDTHPRTPLSVPRCTLSLSATLAHY